MKSDSELQKLRYDNRELREASDRLCSRIEALEAALREALTYCDTDTPQLTVNRLYAALAPEQDK